MSRKRAVIFDFGGVLMKTRDYGPRHAWDDRLGLAHGSVEQAVHNNKSWLKAQTGEIAIADYWADVSVILGINPDDVRDLAHDFYNGDELDEDNISLIEKLRADGFQVALLSNDSLELKPKLQALEIDSLFDPLVISAQIGVMKPDARAYQAVLNRLDRPAGETIFIDDRLENVIGAKSVGIKAVHYTDGMDLDAALADLLYTE